MHHKPTLTPLCSVGISRVQVRGREKQLAVVLSSLSRQWETGILVVPDELKVFTCPVDCAQPRETKAIQSVLDEES